MEGVDGSRVRDGQRDRQAHSEILSDTAVNQMRKVSLTTPCSGQTTIVVLISNIPNWDIPFMYKPTSELL